MFGRVLIVKNLEGYRFPLIAMYHQEHGGAMSFIENNHLLPFEYMMNVPNSENVQVYNSVGEYNEQYENMAQTLYEQCDYLGGKLFITESNYQAYNSSYFDNCNPCEGNNAVFQCWSDYPAVQLGEEYLQEVYINPNIHPYDYEIFLNTIGHVGQDLYLQNTDDESENGSGEQIIDDQPPANGESDTNEESDKESESTVNWLPILGIGVILYYIWSRE